MKKFNETIPHTYIKKGGVMETRKNGVISSSRARRISCVLKGLIIAQIVFLAFTTQSWGGKVKTDNVNCSKGQTITDALEKSDGTPITIVVSGTCNENVLISQDDVTLVTYESPGATIKSADPNRNVITITGSRTVINGLKVIDGWSGILVEGSAAISNATIQNNVKSGISFRNGGRGKVDHCTIQYNGRHGVGVEGGNVTLTGNDISLNAVAGIGATVGGILKIGISDKNSYDGNTISQNGSSGIHMSIGSSAQIGGNTISGNGKTNSLFGRAGVIVAYSSAFFTGGNIIAGNVSSGIIAHGASVGIESGTMLGLPVNQDTYNKINGNGSYLGRNDCDIMGMMGSSLTIGYTDIGTTATNSTSGLCLQMRSTARIVGPTTISGNQNGISLSSGGGLITNDYLSVTGNTNWGLTCSGDESSITPYTINAEGKKVVTGISGNGSGNVTDSCTGF
jgi:parallel beta-helix repeat protein